nr:hypothetical protein [Mucilaginibacter sp. X4EP1]
MDGSYNCKSKSTTLVYYSERIDQVFLRKRYSWLVNHKGISFYYNVFAQILNKTGNLNGFDM